MKIRSDFFYFDKKGNEKTESKANESQKERILTDIKISLNIFQVVEV
jgi:hypothetical protein